MMLALSFNRGAAELMVKNAPFRLVWTIFSNTASSVAPVGVLPLIPALAKTMSSLPKSLARSAKSRLRGVVTSTWIGAARGLEGPLISGRGGGSPRPERFVSQDAKRAAGCEMTLDVERVVNGGMKGQEALG